MAVVVDEDVGARPGPPAPRTREPHGPGRCQNCAAQLSDLSAELCVLCRNQPHADFVARVLSLRALGKNAPEIARELGVRAERVRRAIRRARAAGMATQDRAR